MATQTKTDASENSKKSSNEPTKLVNRNETPVYLAAQPKKSGPSFYELLRHGNLTWIDATFPSDKRKQTWQQKVSMICVKLFWLSYTVTKWMGFMIEWNLNFLVLNGGILAIFWNSITFKWGRIARPDSNADNYLSCIGHLDPRTDLFVDKSEAGKADSTRADTLVFPDKDVGTRRTADVCVMAAKLAYENPAVVKRIVTHCWNMHFVKFFNCWNEHQKMYNTQAFVFMDKPTEAKAVVVAFRGTEAFNTYDWSTDFDFSWVNLENLGKVHLGFLEALGLATREDPSTLKELRNKALDLRALCEGKSFEEQINLSTSPTADNLIHNRGKSLAFDDITRTIAVIMQANPDAKLFITGHSLGGALATLYPVMLYHTGQTQMVDKIGAVYTFGQPRVGDRDFRKNAGEWLLGKYFRIVYCNDMVPRIPFDNDLMQFKHFGDCRYFNSVYDGLTLDEEPNPNYLGFGRMLTMHLNAAWEIFFAMILITGQHGKEYSESWFSIMSRMMGLVMPGASAHSLTNYVNVVRLGPFPLRERKNGDHIVEFRVMVDNVKHIVQAMSVEILKILGFPIPQQGAKVLKD